jgi:hypothetical protein
MRPTRNRPRDGFFLGAVTAMAQRPESCFEKMCGSPTPEKGKAKRLPGDLEGANARGHRPRRCFRAALCLQGTPTSTSWSSVHPSLLMAPCSFASPEARLVSSLQPLPQAPPSALQRVAVLGEKLRGFCPAHGELLEGPCRKSSSSPGGP